MTKEIQLPQGWAKTSYGELLDYIQPGPYIVDSTDYDDSYKIPVLTAGKSFIKGYTNESIGVFDNIPAIIFDDFTTASKYVNFKFKVKSSAMKILVPSSGYVIPELIFYYMQTDKIRSDTHKRYWISVYAKRKLPLPPLNEQKRIVAKIEELFSELDKGIENLKHAQEQLKIYRQSILKHAFEGKLTAKWREEKEVNNSSWENTVLGKVAKWGSGGTPSRKDAAFYTGSIPWIKTGELTSKYVISSEEHITEEAIKKSSAKLFPKGSVAIAMYGATIGKCSIFGIAASTNQACAVAQVHDDLFNEYLYYYLISQRRDFENAGKGGAQPNISQTVIKDWPFKKPSLEEQKQIVIEIEEKFSVIDQLEQDISDNLKRADVLRQAILKKAFSGKLVDQDPNDEPASVLLERIAQEKQQANPAKRTKKKVSNA